VEQSHEEISLLIHHVLLFCSSQCAFRFLPHDAMLARYRPMLSCLSQPTLPIC